MIKLIDKLWLFVKKWPRCFFLKYKYKALAPIAPIHINPNSIKFQLRNEKRKKKQWLPGDIVGGDWDLDIRPRYDEQDVGSINMRQRFVENMPWEETDRFKYSYPKQLKKKGEIRGCKTLEELVDNYYKKVDSLYADIKQNGFRYNAKKKGERFEPIYIYIGRDGKLIYSGGGNHRLHIAKVLGLKSIPVFVRVRHAQWQNYREKVCKKISNNKPLDIDTSHPDLQDILKHSAGI